MGIARGIVAACFVVACGPPQRTEQPKAPPPLEVKTYAPLGIKADAKSPNKAVILGTDDKDGSTIVPLPATAATSAFDAMVVRMKPDVVGNLTRVKVTTGPNPDQSVQVGIFEEFAGGAGPQWRAGVWVAAFVAATTLNKDLTDFTFSASSSGHIDGASASGIIAAGFLASITGAKVDDTATMTGMINPDGTIGPVDGIPEKFLAAIEKGKTRLGYPIGTRYAKSAKSGELIDLEKLARDHKAKAVEVADVHDAYTLLTGQILPRARPVPEADMALDPTFTTAIDARYKVWQQRLSMEWAAILQLESAGRLPAVLEYLRDTSKRFGESAADIHRRGLTGAAYARMFAGSLYAQVANQAYNVLANVQKGKIDEAVALLAKHDNLATLTHDVLTKIGTMRPPTMGGHLQMMAAFRAALRGWIFHSLATRAVELAKAHVATFKGKSSAELGSDATAESVINIVVPTLLYVGKTVAETTLATEQLELQNTADINYMCSLPNVRRMATSFQSAGAAGLTYFDTLLVLPYAEAAKISEDEARQQIAFKEPDYLVAFTGSRLSSLDGAPKDLKATWGEVSLPWGLLSLAGSQLAYLHAAELIAKYYSLGADVADDGSGRVQKIEQEKAFANVLAIAERTARASARAARIATGTIPVQAKLAYQNGIVDRDGTLSDKLDALGQFWAASAYSQSAVMLARN